MESLEPKASFRLNRPPRISGEARGSGDGIGYGVSYALDITLPGGLYGDGLGAGRPNSLGLVYISGEGDGWGGGYGYGHGCSDRSGFRPWKV